MCFVSDRRTSSPGPEAGISPCCSYLAGKRPYTQSHPHWQPDEQSSAEHEDSKRPTRFAAKKRGGSNDRQWDPRWCNGYRASLVCIRKKKPLEKKSRKGFSTDEFPLMSFIGHKTQLFHVSTSSWSIFFRIPSNCCSTCTKGHQGSPLVMGAIPIMMVK